MLPKIENVKNLFRAPESAETLQLEYVPYLYIEAKIDFSDIRTGFRETYNLSRAFPAPSSRLEPLWDDDTARDVDRDTIGTAVPEKACLGNLPGYIDGPYMSWIETRFIQHLLRTFAVKAYRNFSLDVYSRSGESRNDFIIRCIDLSQSAMYREFDSLHEVFKRKLERLRQKYLNAEGSLEPGTSLVDSRIRELFSSVTERISALFLRTEFSIQRVRRPSGIASQMHELEEGLQALHFEAQEAVTRILDSYEDKIISVDEYVLHPTMRDIHFVSSCVLWMPAGEY